MRAILICLMAAACAPDRLTVSPTSFALGEVNVQQDRPSEGYAARDLILRNTGSRTLDITFTGVDTEHIFLGTPVFVRDNPLTLPPLAGDDSTVVSVGAFGYGTGELTTEITGTFQVNAQGQDPIVVDWSFTPVRQRVEDTASP